jgi:hypothetical protein
VLDFWVDQGRHHKFWVVSPNDAERSLIAKTVNPRYLAEFDFRYNNRAKLGITDGERTVNAMKGIEGKRLTYRRADATAQ